MLGRHQRQHGIQPHPHHRLRWGRGRSALALVSHPGFFTFFPPRGRSVPAGPAGLLCAETLRQEGFTDRIVMCTMDRHPPYDRPKLSKVCTHTRKTTSQSTFTRGALTCGHQSLESTAEQLRLRSADFLRDHDIELITEKEVGLRPGNNA